MVLTIDNKNSALALTVLLIGLSLFNILPTQAQNNNNNNLSPQDIFELPEINGSINFSVNGTYTDAILENGVWVFNNLSLSGSRFQGVLKFSAKNCNVTIHFFRSNVLRYTVEGVGEQVINLGLNSSKTSHPSEWSVINQDSVFFAEGKNWHLLSDNTIVVCDLVGTLTVMHYNYGYPIDDRPFYLQHSIIILTLIAVAVTVTVTSVIKWKTLRRLT